MRESEGKKLSIKNTVTSSAVPYDSVFKNKGYDTEIIDNRPNVITIREVLKNTPENVIVQEGINTFLLLLELEGYNIVIVTDKDTLGERPNYVPIDHFYVISKNKSRCVDLFNVFNLISPELASAIHMNLLPKEKFEYQAQYTCPFPESLEDIYGLFHEWGHHLNQNAHPKNVPLPEQYPELVRVAVRDERDAWAIGFKLLKILEETNFIDFDPKKFYTYAQSQLSQYEKFYQGKTNRIISAVDARVHFTNEQRRKRGKLGALRKWVINFMNKIER